MEGFRASRLGTCPGSILALCCTETVLYTSFPPAARCPESQLCACGLWRSQGKLWSETQAGKLGTKGLCTTSSLQGKYTEGAVGSAAPAQSSHRFWNVRPDSIWEPKSSWRGSGSACLPGFPFSLTAWGVPLLWFTTSPVSRGWWWFALCLHLHWTGSSKQTLQLSTFECLCYSQHARGSYYF